MAVSNLSNVARSRMLGPSSPCQSRIDSHTRRHCSPRLSTISFSASRDVKATLKMGLLRSPVAPRATYSRGNGVPWISAPRAPRRSAHRSTIPAAASGRASAPCAPRLECNARQNLDPGTPAARSRSAAAYRRRVDAREPIEVARNLHKVRHRLFSKSRLRSLPLLLATSPPGRLAVHLHTSGNIRNFHTAARSGNDPRRPSPHAHRHAPTPPSPRMEQAALFS